MTKKKSNLKEVNEPVKVKIGRVKVAFPNEAQSITPTNTIQQSGSESQASSVVEGFGTQVFASEQQALEVLISQVVEKFEDDPEEQDEMRRFLSEVLATDPALREEILAGATIRG